MVRCIVQHDETWSLQLVQNLPLKIQMEGGAVHVLVVVSKLRLLAVAAHEQLRPIHKTITSTTMANYEA